MGSALIGFLGAVLGVAATLFVSGRTRQAAEELAEKQRDEERIREVVALAADAFSLALDAVTWMGSSTVEDSVDPRFADLFGPKSVTAETSAREARLKLNKVFALRGATPLGSAAGDVARGLGSLLHAWEWSQDARRDILSAAPAKPNKWTVTWFDQHFKRLNEVRFELTGVHTHDLDPGDPGSAITSEGSLERLRQAISAAQL